MTNSKLVSVVIPVYKRFELASRAIQSVVRQTYRPVEVIAVDDFSPEVFKYEEELPDDNITIKIIRAKENGGPGVSREIGRQACSGSYISYLDSDDMFKEDYLEKMVAYLEKHPDIDMVYCHAKFMSPEKGISDQSVKKTHLEYKEILPCLLTHGRPWHSSACLRRKSLTDKIGPWKPIWFWEDYEYDSRAAIVNNKLGYVPEVLCYIDKDDEQKVTANPNRAKKDRSYGLAALHISNNVSGSSYSEGDIGEMVIYHLLKSAARNLDVYNYDVAEENIKEAARWFEKNKMELACINLALILNKFKMASLGARLLRKMSISYKKSALADLK